MTITGPTNSPERSPHNSAISPHSPACASKATSSPAPSQHNSANSNKLEHLNLYDNQLTGTIPAQLGQLTNLENLNLHNNQLTGTIPATLNKLTQLEHLSLSGNQLTGTIPAALGQTNKLAKLKTLHIHDNNLTGTIPAELNNLNLNKNGSPHMGGSTAYSHGLLADTPALCRPSTITKEPWGKTIYNPIYKPIYKPIAECPATPAAPGAPDAPTATPTPSGTALEVSWTPPASNAAEITGYTVAHREAPTSSTTAADWTETTTTTNRTKITGLKKNTTYHIRINATNTPTPGNPQTGPWSPTTPQNTTPDDRDILTVIYEKTGGEHWRTSCQTNWNNTQQPLNKWGGTYERPTDYIIRWPTKRVITDDKGRVTELDLSGCGLTGTIPTEIAQLTELTDLRLGSNHLTGTIPKTLGNLTRLTHLHLHNHNNYAGDGDNSANWHALYQTNRRTSTSGRSLHQAPRPNIRPLLHLRSLAQ